MVGLVIFIVGVLTLPFLFPETTIAWLRQILRWLEQRREKRERDVARLDRLDQELMEWGLWVATLHRQLPRTHPPNRRYHLLAQALAAGERYLQSAGPRECPQLYHQTERICQRLRHELSQLGKRSTKNGAKPCNLAPRFSG